jgi:hypothetical protein
MSVSGNRAAKAGGSCFNERCPCRSEGVPGRAGGQGILFPFPRAFPCFVFSPFTTIPCHDLGRETRATSLDWDRGMCRYADPGTSRAALGRSAPVQCGCVHPPRDPNIGYRLASSQGFLQRSRTPPADAGTDTTEGGNAGTDATMFPLLHTVYFDPQQNCIAEEKGKLYYGQSATEATSGRRMPMPIQSRCRFPQVVKANGE